MPTLTDFGFLKTEISKKYDPRACYDFKGGESHGLKRMKEYIFTNKSFGTYALTRSELTSGSEYSSKLSPWLACGSLSCRTVYFETKEYMKKHGSVESASKFIDQLFWRDFIRFWCMRNANKVFSEYGIYNRTYYKW